MPLDFYGLGRTLTCRQHLLALLKLQFFHLLPFVWRQEIQFHFFGLNATAVIITKEICEISGLDTQGFHGFSFLRIEFSQLFLLIFRKIHRI